MSFELKYHEQKEGWTHEWLGDKHCVAIIRPRELGGGFVTVDFERRLFGTGYGKPWAAATTTQYGGKGWKEQIVRDAIDYLEGVMSTATTSQSLGSSPGREQVLSKLREGYTLHDRGTGWFLSPAKRAGGAADSVQVDRDLMREMEEEGTLKIVMLTSSMRAELPRAGVDEPKGFSFAEVPRQDRCRWFVRYGAKTMFDRGFRSKNEANAWLDGFRSRLDWRTGYVARLRGDSADIEIVDRKGQVAKI